MKDISSDIHREFSKHIASSIIGAMCDTSTSFEALAQKLDISINELRNIIYGINKDITIGELTQILNVLGYRANFTLTPIHKKINNIRHLRLIRKV